MQKFRSSLIHATAMMSVIGISTSYADDLTIPNTFQAGTPARAAEVNANFDAVEASVDDNAADISANTADVTQINSTVSGVASDVITNTADIQSNTAMISTVSAGSGVMVYSQGTQIGRLLGVSADVSGYIWVLSSNGFVYQIGTATTPLRPYLNEYAVYFSESNCTGNSYIPYDEPGRKWAPAVGWVFGTRSGAPASAYYTARGTDLLIDEPYQSYFSGVCINTVNSRDMWPVFPNDETVTGVSNTAPAGSLRLGLP